MVTASAAPDHQETQAEERHGQHDVVEGVTDRDPCQKAALVFPVEPFDRPSESIRISSVHRGDLLWELPDVAAGMSLDVTDRIPPTIAVVDDGVSGFRNELQRSRSEEHTSELQS